MYRRTGALVIVAALGVACGGSTGSPSSATGNRATLSVIEAAAAATENAGSMHVSGTMRQKSANVDASASFSGDMSLKPLQAVLRVSKLTVNGQSAGDATELITPVGFYMKSSIFADRVGKPWVLMRFSDMKATSGLDLKGLLSQAEQMQPGQYIKQLAAAGQVSDEGSETIDGVATTHYAGTVSAAQMLKDFSADVRQQLKSTLQSTGITGTHIDAFIDSRGLVRRIDSASVGGSGQTQFSFDVSHYGEAVHVTVPPADQVADLGSLLGQ